MPNLKPPVTTTEMALAYRERIVSSGFGGEGFEPLMTLYLTDRTPPEEITAAKESGKVFAVKYYPAGATTNSDSGVTDLDNVIPTLQRMAEVGMPLCVHGEVTDRSVDIFDRERVFLETVLPRIVAAAPTLKIILEHITTEDAVEFVRGAGDNVAATITAHHLLYNRNAIFDGGIRPHYYCLPVLKRERHREALNAAVRSGSPKFFAGTDSAPHPAGAKEAECGCAGCFTAHAAVELYAEAFEKAGCLEHLDAFLSKNGAAFYGLPRNEGPALVLRRADWTVPASYDFGDGVVVPLRANETIHWQVDE